MILCSSFSFVQSSVCILLQLKGVRKLKRCGKHYSELIRIRELLSYEFGADSLKFMSYKKSWKQAWANEMLQHKCSACLHSYSEK
jgi:hypothetical protein